MGITHTKTSKILIVVVAVLAAGFIMGFGDDVFGGNDYNSSVSNSSMSVSTAKVNEEAGNILMRYGIGGAEINEVTDALERGISAVDLKVLLVRLGVSEAGIAELLAKLDGLGVGVDSLEKESAAGGAVSAPGAGDTPQPAIVDQELHRPPTELPLKQKEKEPSPITIEKQIFQDAQTNAVRDLKIAASPEQREAIRKELQTNREAFQDKIQALRQNTREQAKQLRQQYYQIKLSDVIVLRIAVAHGKGLRMLNRFRSAIARFDHILGRLESRIEKIRIEIETPAPATSEGTIKVLFPPSSVVLLVEEAKNMQVEAEAKMEQLKAKYESLLLGENPRGTAEEARAIATELKAEIENLHAQLREIADEIRQARKNYISSLSNTKPQ